MSGVKCEFTTIREGEPGYDARTPVGRVTGHTPVVADGGDVRLDLDVPGSFRSPVVADGGGLRHNEGKLRLDLLPVEWIWALGDVMTVGSKKYAVRNWERGMAWSTVVGCTLRHTFKFIAGERFDKETGCHHLAMAAWNILALMVYDIRGIGENDLMQVGMEMLEKVHGDPGES